MATDRMEVHSHTHYSNIRLLDCINKPKDLVNRAIEQGLKGICITDHEALCCHIEMNVYQKEIQKTNPDFKIGLGNEIYLVHDRSKNQKYYHFILIAKNATGHKALRELSSNSWLQSYYDRDMERVPTTYEELAAIVEKYPNSLIATTACIGGYLGQRLLELKNSNLSFDAAKQIEQQIINFLTFCKNLFNDDFYLECAPARTPDQKYVNQKIMALSQLLNIKMVIGTDAHYLDKNQAFAHEAYLNSKNGEREVKSFYEYSYLQTETEIKENLPDFLQEQIEKMFANSMEIYNKIEIYDLTHKQEIAKVKVKDYPKKEMLQEYEVLHSLAISDDQVERYWVNQCVDELKKRNLYNDTYLSRLEEEADVKRVIGQKLETNMFMYPVTLQHYIDLIWECGSTVGAGRGSSCSGLNHYLLGVTQLNPIEHDFPFFRYLNKERVELGDIDIDIAPSKRPKILKAIKKERGANFNVDVGKLARKNLGCVFVATFGTEATRSAVLTAARGYRSEEYPNGIDVDIAQYLTTLIPSERGFLWSIHDVVYGNPEKGRKPVAAFVSEITKYEGLLDIVMQIEGLVNKRSSHASGVILLDEDPYNRCAFMKTPKGEVITQYDLHDAEKMGNTKYDFLVTEIQDKIITTIKLLQEAGEIDPNLTLKEVYNRYLHPDVLDYEDEKVWKAIQDGNVINLFQFDSPVGKQAIKKIKPKLINELTDANGLMRLMASEKGAEMPMDKYVRFKNNINLWYQEMKDFGLTEEEMKIVEPYFKSSYGVPPSQEQLMMMLMDKNICHFTLAESNDARKIVGRP